MHHYIVHQSVDPLIAGKDHLFCHGWRVSNESRLRTWQSMIKARSLACNSKQMSISNLQYCNDALYGSHCWRNNTDITLLFRREILQNTNPKQGTIWSWNHTLSGPDVTHQTCPLCLLVTFLRMYNLTVMPIHIFLVTHDAFTFLKESAMLLQIQ